MTKKILAPLLGPLGNHCIGTFEKSHNKSSKSTMRDLKLMLHYFSQTPQGNSRMPPISPHPSFYEIYIYIY